MRTPHQRPKRLNDGHSLANVAREVMEHMQSGPGAVSLTLSTAIGSYRAKREATETRSVALAQSQENPSS
jgi:hypothetical protein